MDIALAICISALAIIAALQANAASEPDEDAKGTFAVVDRRGS
ncbi:MAG: hypothetical protein ACK5JT_11770 [Hyphomicrobiaceae bacterium]